MKKRVLAGGLALVLLTGGVAAFADSQSNTLVSLSYLNGIFWNDLTAIVRMDVDRNTTALYNEFADQAGSGGAEAGSGTFATQSGVNGDIVSASVGYGLIWAAGSGVVQSGILVDATEGREVNPGGTLTVGHRYLAGTDAALVVTSDTAQWMAEGTWSVTAGNPVQPPVALPFTDVNEGEWYYNDVAYVYRSGLFYGTSETEFSPNGKMQRCMMTTVLHRLAGKPSVSYSALFQDIPDGKWYTLGTIWAGQTGVVNGVGDGRFNPSANVTRQEIALILYRYAAKMGYDVSASADLSGFSDSASVASWSKAAMSWAVGAGILNGDNRLLRPEGDAARSEVSAMLHRFDNWSKR